MYIAIYQIDMARDPDNLCFMDYERTNRIQGSPAINSSIYNKVFEGSVKADTMEDVYKIFNLQHPESYTGRSLSVSDVVQVVEDNPFGSAFYFCDSFGFKRIDFDSSKAQDLVHPPVSKDGPIRLDARLAISVEVTRAELEQLGKGDADAQKLLLSLIHSDRCTIGGDTYFPGPWNPDYLEDDLNFDLPYAPLHPVPEKKPSLDDQIKSSQARTPGQTVDEKGREEGLDR